MDKNEEAQPGCRTTGDTMTFCHDRTVLAFVVWTLCGMGGSEKVVFDIVRKLDKSRYEIVVISFDDGPVAAVYRGLGVKVRIVGGPGLAATAWNLRRVLVDEKIEIMNPHHFGPFFRSFVAACGLGIECVYTEHSRWQMEQLPGVWRSVHRFMLQRVSAVVALSPAIERYYADEICLDRGRIHVIPNGVDLELYRPTDGPASRRGGDSEDTVIGTIAHLRPEKNHKVLIKAFKTLIDQGTKGRLIVVGRDLMQGEIQRFAASFGLSDRILFLGERDDAAAIMKSFDVFCLPSLYEGMPLTILEAMASGIPVVGSDVMGINELVRHGENGLLFRSNDAEQLANRLRKVIEDRGLRERLSAAGRKCAETDYSLDDKVTRYDSLFRSMASSGRPA